MIKTGPYYTELSDDVARAHGLPTRVSTERLYLSLAIQNPEGYSEAMKAISNAGLYDLLEPLERQIQLSSLGLGYMVPPQHEPELVLLLQGLQARIHAEAARRGVGLTFPPSMWRN